MRRIILSFALGAFGAILLCPAVKLHAYDNKSGSSAPLVHVVIVHMKPDAPSGAADEIIADAHEMLAKVPTVRDLVAGRPAKKPGQSKDTVNGTGASPDRAKSDYEIGLMLRFDDVEGLQAYEKHPLHLKFVTKHGKHVQIEKLTIFDFVDEKK